MSRRILSKAEKEAFMQFGKDWVEKKEILANEQNQGVVMEYLLQFFSYAHLPPHLQTVSKPFADLANQIVETCPRNPERTTALRKLLEAKDCAVRALIFKEEPKS